MLTNTEVTAAQPPQTAATTIAIEDAELRCRAALSDIGRLIRTGKVSAIEAADLETETITRFIAQTRELETRGAEDVAPPPTADRVACAETQRRPRHPAAPAATGRARSALPLVRCASGRCASSRQGASAPTYSAGSGSTTTRRPSRRAASSPPQDCSRCDRHGPASSD